MEKLIANELRSFQLWHKLQSSLTLEEAIFVSTNGAGKYVLSDFVQRSTRGYHHGNTQLMLTLFQSIMQHGIDVVDESEEAIYRCVMNVDEEGHDRVLIAHAKGLIQGAHSGVLYKLGVPDGVLSKNYPGHCAINKL